MARRRAARSQVAAGAGGVVLRHVVRGGKPRAVLAALRQRCLVGQAMALALWNAPAFAQNVITPDGRTQTAVSVVGNTTTITTSTIVGGAGYNSFSRFEQGAGTTVNMYLPQDAGVLVNIVRDGPVVINGILNSYRNGRIGGHVYFSDSAGFTVGPNGVINTGRLTVNTPTREFLDQVIGPDGVVNETMAARLRANDVPISPDGKIAIDGTINARRGVSLNGQSVSVSGQIKANTAPVEIAERRERHRTAFAQSVNTTGLRHGAAMVARRGGGIEIVAAGSVNISGRVSADATARRAAGTINVRSGKGTTLARTAKITATGMVPVREQAQAVPSHGPLPAAVNTGSSDPGRDGGKVSITSDAAIAIARGAMIDVSAARNAAGKGGSAILFAGTNLDAEDGAVFRGTAGTSGDGGFVELSAKQVVTLGAIDVDFSARNGKAGLLYIDPIDIVVGPGGRSNTIVNGTDVILEATNSITILGEGMIDTRNFNRNAEGGVLSATNPSIGNSGNITIEAPRITVAGQLLAGVSPGSLHAAGDVTLTASATDDRNSGKASAEAIIEVSGTITGRDVKLLADATGKSSFINLGPGLVMFTGQTQYAIFTGLNAGYVASDITARVSVKDGASITATRDLVVSATGSQEAAFLAASVTAVSPVAASVTYADLKARVTAEVESGASLTVGRNLTVAAKNEATLGAAALAASAGQGLSDFAVAVGLTDIETKAIVSSGAEVTLGSSSSNVRVSAINENSFSTSATAMSISGGMVGLSVAYSDTKASAEARLGASLGSSGGRIGTVTVEAISDNSKNATASAVTLGQNLVIETLQIANAMEVIFAPLTSRLGPREIGKFGSTITLAKTDLSAVASIAADAGDAAPTIYATKTAVVSDVRDFALRAAADAAISSNSKNPTAVNPEALVSMAAGVVYGDFRHTSRASIGSSVIVDSDRIGVSAKNEVPIANTWTNWGGFNETFTHLNGTAGVAGNILTSYASATTESRDLGLAGAVNYYKIANETEAYVGPGATLRQNNGLGSWNVALGTGALASFDKVVTVAASTKTETIDVAGNYGIFSGTGTSGGTGTAVGGSFADLQRESRTVAAIGAGVRITALELAVTAKTEDKIFAIAPTSGKAAGTFAANGIVVLTSIDNHTLASISNQAIVDVTSIDVDARQFVSLFTLTGALTYGSENSVGISVAALDTAGVTRAYVGDNSADLSDNRLGSGYGRGLITARSLDVDAVTDGRMMVASVAAAISDPNASKLSFFKGIAAGGDAAAAVKRSGASGSISLTAAGSAAVATTTLGTSAWIDGAAVIGKDGGVVATDVAATNATIADVGSGTAALNLAGKASPLSGSLAGAVAIATFDNSTDARIAGTTITRAGDTSVQALAGGRQTVVGVSIAAGRNNSGAAAVSAAVGIVTDSVTAQIRNSTIDGLSGASSGNDVLVNAYRATDIGIGGGAAYAGVQAGLGLAVTYSSITDPSGRDGAAALITDSSLFAVDKLTVAARTSSRIVSGAIAGGGGPDSNGLVGTIVINEVSPTTRAAVADSAGAPSRIAMDGDVLVVADGGKDSTLDAALGSRLANTDQGPIDFTGRATNANAAANPVGASIIAIAGVLQGGSNNAGVSFLRNTISQSHIALIANIDLTSSTAVTVRAQDGSLITGVAVGAGLATGQFAGVASVVQQTIDNVISAQVIGGSIMSRDVAVQSQASSAIRGSAGSLGIGIGAAAVGLSIVDSSIANNVATGVDGAQIRASRDVVLTAGSTATIDTIAIGVAMSRNVGLAGSIANNTVATDIGAIITGSDIIAGNNLGVFSGNTDRITVSAGALGVTVAAPSVAGGVSVVNNTVGGDTVARIEDSSVDARAGGTGSLSYSAGQLLTAFDLSTANGPSAAQPSLAMTARAVHGLGVVATSQQSVLANAVTGGVAAFPISGAVAIVPVRNVLGGSTSATIDSSHVGTRLTGTDSTAVAVEAASHSYAGTFITVGAVGGIAASGANTTNVMERSTRAALTNSTTGTTTPGYTGPGVNALDIASNASQSASSNVLGFALGAGGAAAMGIVNTFAASTSAALDQGLVTAGRVGVAADSRNGFNAVTRTAAGGAGIGIGGAFIVGTSRNETLATVGGGSGQTALNLNGGLAVAAVSRNAFTTVATGGAVAGVAGVAGMVSFVDVDNETRAGLYGAQVAIRPGATQTVGGITGAAGVSVAASETTSITPKTAAGANASFAAGAAANIASLDSLVQADIQGSNLVAPGAVSASATSDRTVNAETTTFGAGGSAGIGASVAMISVGKSTPAGASGELTYGGGGTLSRIGQLTAGNADLVLSAAGLASYRSYRGAAGAAMSESALRDAARTEYNLLLANGTVSGGALTLTTAGVIALRSAAAAGLGIANPDETQVRDWAAARYTAFRSGVVAYLLSDAGVSSYRAQVTPTIPDATEDQVRSSANTAYARLLANGTVSNGVLTLSVAGITSYRAEAEADLGRAATDAEVRDYAAQQYGFFTANRSRIAAPEAQSAAALLESTGSGTRVAVSGGSIASGSVAVSALSRTTTTNIASGLGAGGAAGVGAATAYTDVGDKVSARLDQISVGTGSITVTASSTDGTGSAARIEARAGAGALGAAAGAAVADGSIANEVRATLGGTLTVAGATSVNAGNGQTSRSDAVGAAVAGGLALGISRASSSADSTVEAKYLDGSSLTGTGLTIGAQSTGAAHAAAIAGAGGLLAAGSGAEAKASDTSDVSAVVGAGARANVATGTISISASASPDAKAAAYGAAVSGGLAVGAAVAKATVGATVNAEIMGNASLIANQFIAGNLSVTATGSVFGTMVGDAARLANTTSDFARGGSSAAASAMAGSGAYYASAVGTDAQAKNTSTVTAKVGNYVGLSSASATISASNTTLQAANATGKTAAAAAIGTVNAQADSRTVTTASLGANSTMSGSGTGRFTLTATGEDTQIARAEAGSGGLLAGSGAEGSTSNISDVTASVGAGAVIQGGLVTVGASHETRYAAIVDSLQAAALGASAAKATNSADVDVLTELGAGSRITAAGPNTAGCYLTSCLQAISLTSRNAFTQLNLGESVRAAAGGGINGAGATSKTEIDGTSKVTLGNGVNLLAGLSPTAAPGPILVQAWTELAGNDTATLTTGGLLQGAGVSSRYRAGTAQKLLANAVTLGDNVLLDSFGVINLGTYTLANVRANAFVSTYGLAGVGVADADVTILTGNNVTIGANSELIGLYDVNVTAGRDGAGLRTNTLSGTATALGYVRGLIAVPDADASTNLQNHARVQVGSGTRISSAQNVTLGAYDGVLDADADGTGHGYQLYFIPVTEGSSSPGRSSSSTLVMNGTATAGIYNTQRIEIGCGVNASAQCGPNETPTVRFVSGAPVTATYTTGFDPVAYITARYDATVASTLLSGVSPGPVKAVRLSQLYAAGGNIFVNAGTVQGSGSLIANGGPSITVINRSNAYLVLDGGAYIPESKGGQIVGSSGSLTRHSNPDAAPSIIIDNAYTGQLDARGNGPALLISSDVTNLGGLVSINNTLGSFGFSGQRIDALQFNVTVPNGAVAVSSNGPNGMYTAGASPQAEYGSHIYYPGGAPGSTSFDVDQAVIAAANALAAGSGQNVNRFLYGTQADAPGRNRTVQFFGNCAGYIADSGYNCTGGWTGFGNDINFRLLETIATYRESNPVTLRGDTKIYGAQVAIKATTININAAIEAGRITNWSGTVDAGIAASLRNSRQNYLNDGYVHVSLKQAIGGVWANDGAAPLYYDLVNDRLVLYDINASSGGGSVLLDGQIISTNLFGSIKINGGFGDVSLNNTSGLDLVVNRINTGTAAGVNASVSKITIIDRLVTSGPNTTVYAYTPGSGIAKYKTHNGTQPILSGVGATTPVEFISGDTTRYTPVAGTRYEWTQQALLKKEGLTEANRNQRDVPQWWRFDSGTSSNPWVYVDAKSVSTYDGSDPLLRWSRSPQAPSGTSVSGRVTNNLGLTHVGMTQEITGGHTMVINNMAHYGGCQGGSPNYCDRGFVASNGAGQAIWNYDYVTEAFVQVTASVKADNPFGISFAGNAAGRVNITSNSSVLQNGTIVNPSGTTTITASGGSFTQTNNATILSNNLTLTSRDSIGTASAAVKATLTPGAQLNVVTGSGGINLDITGSARVVALRADQTPGAYGDVKVQASGSLEAVVTGAPNVVGRNITLVSEEGSVGSTSNLLQMRAVATQLPNGSSVDGVVTVTARGDIGIAQIAGDLRVGQIASEAGNVRIDVNAGRLVSAAGQTAAQALSAEQLSQVSRSLKLTAADGANAAAQGSLAAFEKQVTQTYSQYAALLRNGSYVLEDTNGDGVKERVFKLNDNAVALYQAFADAELGTGANVNTYAAQRLSAYGSVFAKVYGSSWADQARFNVGTLETNYSFSFTGADVTPGLASQIAGDAVWTERQLVSAINKSALEPASGVVGNGTALVIGRDVTLNTAGSIGSLAPDVQVALSDIRNGTISNTQLAALAVATTAGTVKIIGQRQDGSFVEVTDLNNVPAGVTLTRVDVKQTAPLFINASGAFSGSAQGDVYVQATGAPNSAGGTLTIGRITATGTVNLQAPQAIAVATQADGTTPRNPVQIQANGDLVLVAGGGAIGSAATSLTYQIGGRLVSASASAGDVNLVAKGGDAQIGRIFASGTASLTAADGGIQGYLPGVAISASSIRLSAAGNVGSATAGLGVRVGSTGDVSGTIAGSAWFSGPALAGQAPTAFRIGDLAARDGLSVIADGQIDVLSRARSSAGAVSLTGAGIVMAAEAAISAAGRATLSSGSDIVLGRVASTFAPAAGGASIALTATGAITSNGDSGVLLDARQAGGVVSLYAGNGIGTQNAALTFAAPTISARSLRSGVNLAATGSTRVTSLQADLGSIALSADGDLSFDAVVSGAGAMLSTSNGRLTLGVLTAGDSSSLSASGAIMITSATTTAGDLSVSSTGAGIAAAGIDAARDATLTAATSISVTTALTTGRAATAEANGGALDIVALSAGANSTLTASGAITLGSATTTAGDLSITSTGAGITAASIDAAQDATLTAGTSISVTTGLVSGGAANVSANGGMLGIVALSAGAGSTLTASGAITLGSATTTAGDLSIASTNAGIVVASIDAAQDARLTAGTSVSVTTGLTTGRAAAVSANGGTLNLAALTAGASSTLMASGAVTLGAAMTTAGDLSVTSMNAGIAAVNVEGAQDAVLTAATFVSVTTGLTAGRTATVAANGGALDIATLTAGASATLTASGAITLGSATTTSGDLSVTSAGASITAASIDAAGNAALTAATFASVTTGLAGGAAIAAANGGALDIAALTAGANSMLRASGAVTLGSASTTSGDLSVTSAGDSITATSIEVAAGAATIAANGGTLGIVALTAGASSTLTASGAITLGSAKTTAGDLSVTSTGAGIAATSIDAARDAALTAATFVSVTTGLTSGGAATVAANAGALGILALVAGASSTLTASGAVTLDSASTTAGDLSISSANAGITAASLDVARGAVLTAGTFISLTTSLAAGGAVTATANGGTLDIVALTAGASSMLTASGVVTLGSARTTVGDLSVNSAGAEIAAMSIDIAGGATLAAATSVVVVDSMTAGTTANVTALGGAVDLGSLKSGSASAVTASGAVIIGDVRTVAGHVVITSTGAGIRAGRINAAGNAILTAATSIAVADSVKADRAANFIARDGALDLISLTVGADSSLAASGTIALGSAIALAGDLSISSTHSSIAAGVIAAADGALLSAGTFISITTGMTVGGSASVTASGGRLDLVSLSAGASSSLRASGAINLGSATTTAGDLAVTSTNAGITAADLKAAHDASLIAATGIAVTSGMTTGGSANVVASGGALDLVSLSAGASSFLRASGAIRLGSVTTTAGNLTVTSTNAGITAADLKAAHDTVLTAATGIAVTSGMTTGGAATLEVSAGALELNRLAADATSALIASGAVTIGSARITTGSIAIASTGAGITAASIDTADAATLTAGSFVSVATGLTAGGAVTVSANGGRLDLVSLIAGAGSALTASDSVMLGAARVTEGDLAITSTGAGITAARLDVAKDATLTAATSIAVTAGLTAGGAANVAASGGLLDLASLSAGASSTLTAFGAVTLGSVTTTAGDLSIASMAASITAASVTAARDATLTAGAFISITTGMTAGGAADVSANGGPLEIVSLSAAASSTLTASGAISLGRVTTTAGDLVVASTRAGITATSIAAARDANLTAATLVSLADHLTAGGAAAVSANAGPLAIAALTAGASATLTASGAVMLGHVRTMAGDLTVTSTGAGIDAASLGAANDARLTAATSIGVTTGLTAGGVAVAAANGGALDLVALTAGASTILTASGPVVLGHVRTTAGDLSITSTNAGIAVASVDAGGSAALQAGAGLSASRLAAGGGMRLAAGGSIEVGAALAGGDLELSAAERIVIAHGSARSGEVMLSSVQGSIHADAIEAAGAVTAAGPGELSFGWVRSGADIALTSTAGLIRIGTLTSGRDVGLQARSIGFDLVDAGRSARLTADENIAGASVVATDALAVQAGRSGRGSLEIGTGAARNAAFGSADEIRLGRFGAGDSIVILGTRIAADIVQLPTGAGLPLVLDVAGLRERTAQSVDLRIEAQQFEIGRFEAIDGLLSTTSNDFGIAAAFVPGALQVRSPSMAILANNRSPAPVTGYDAQLYQRDRVFSLAVNGKRLTTSAFVVGFDTDVVDVPNGLSFSRDLARLGVLLPTGPSFGEIARGFVLGPDGRWRSMAGDPDTTASTGARSKALVNLDGFEGQP